ncbi:MAG: hypothetical protein RR784_07520 [Burkholderiaceae bacterium]
MPLHGYDSAAPESCGFWPAAGTRLRPAAKLAHGMAAIVQQ